MIKKFLFIALAILLGYGIANAAGIPTVVDPAKGPEIWTQEVFNDSGGALTSGSVVVWDYTDDDMYAIQNRKMYITTTTTADDIAVAGVVVDPSIADQTVGTIAIYGPVPVKSAVGGITLADAVGTSGTAKRAASYAETDDDNGILGWVVAATSSSTYDGGTDLPIVFIEKSITHQ